MQDDEKAIRQLVATWVSATEAGDDALVLSLIAEDALFLTPGRPPMSKADFAVGQAGLKTIQFKIRSEVQEVEVFADWAYCRSNLSVVVTPPNGGPTVKRSGSALSILRKQGGAWVIVRDANLLAAVTEGS